MTAAVGKTVVSMQLIDHVAARLEQDPGTLYADLTGSPVAHLVAVTASPAQKRRLAALSSKQVASTKLAGERIESILTHAPGNGAAIWDGRYLQNLRRKFRSAEHLQTVLQEAQAMVDTVIGPA